MTPVKKCKTGGEIDSYTSSSSSSSITQMDQSEDINNHIAPHGDGDQKEDTESDLGKLSIVT